MAIDILELITYADFEEYVGDAELLDETETKKYIKDASIRILQDANKGDLKSDWDDGTITSDAKYHIQIAALILTNFYIDNGLNPQEASNSLGFGSTSFNSSNSNYQLPQEYYGALLKSEYYENIVYNTKEGTTEYDDLGLADIKNDTGRYPHLLNAKEVVNKIDDETIDANKKSDNAVSTANTSKQESEKALAEIKKLKGSNIENDSNVAGGTVSEALETINNKPIPIPIPWDYNAQGNPLINLGEPTNKKDATTKDYVDWGLTPLKQKTVLFGTDGYLLNTIYDPETYPQAPLTQKMFKDNTHTGTPISVKEFNKVIQQKTIKTIPLTFPTSNIWKWNKTLLGDTSELFNFTQDGKDYITDKIRFRFSNFSVTASVNINTTDTIIFELTPADFKLESEGYVDTIIGSFRVNDRTGQTYVLTGSLNFGVSREVDSITGSDKLYINQIDGRVNSSGFVLDKADVEITVLKLAGAEGLKGPRGPIGPDTSHIIEFNDTLNNRNLAMANKVSNVGENLKEGPSLFFQSYQYATLPIKSVSFSDDPVNIPLPKGTNQWVDYYEFTPKNIATHLFKHLFYYKLNPFVDKTKQKYRIIAKITGQDGIDYALPYDYDLKDFTNEEIQKKTFSNFTKLFADLNPVNAPYDYEMTIQGLDGSEGSLLIETESASTPDPAIPGASHFEILEMIPRTDKLVLDKNIHFNDPNVYTNEGYVMPVLPGGGKDDTLPPLLVYAISNVPYIETVKKVLEIGENAAGDITKTLADFGATLTNSQSTQYRNVKSGETTGSNVATIDDVNRIAHTENPLIDKNLLKNGTSKSVTIPFVINADGTIDDVDLPIEKGTTANTVDYIDGKDQNDVNKLRVLYNVQWNTGAAKSVNANYNMIFTKQNNGDWLPTSPEIIISLPPVSGFDDPERTLIPQGLIATVLSPNKFSIDFLDGTNASDYAGEKLFIRVDQIWYIEAETGGGGTTPTPTPISYRDFTSIVEQKQGLFTNYIYPIKSTWKSTDLAITKAQIDKFIVGSTEYKTDILRLIFYNFDCLDNSTQNNVDTYIVDIPFNEIETKEPTTYYNIQRSTVIRSNGNLSNSYQYCFRFNVCFKNSGTNNLILNYLDSAPTNADTTHLKKFTVYGILVKLKGLT